MIISAPSNVISIDKIGMQRYIHAMFFQME